MRRDGRHGGIENGLYGVQPATLGDVYKVDWVDGNNADLRNLNAAGILLEKGEASSLHVKVGSPVRLLSNSRKTATVTVRGIYKDDSLLQGGMITTGLLHSLTDVKGVQIVLATVKPGSNPEEVAKLAGDKLAAQFPTAKLQSNAEFKKSIGDQVNTLLFLIYALLGVSVLISLFGIVNTLLLSVYERTREIGMLRAIGMTRRQLRRTIRFESAITAVIGSLLGPGHRRRLRLDRDAGPVRRGARVRGAVGHADRLPDRGGDRGHPGRCLAGLARLAHEGPGRPQLRVAAVSTGRWAGGFLGKALPGMPLLRQPETERPSVRRPDQEPGTQHRRRRDPHRADGAGVRAAPPVRH